MTFALINSKFLALHHRHQISFPSIAQCSHYFPVILVCLFFNVVHVHKYLQDCFVENNYTNILLIKFSELLDVFRR